MVKGRSEGRKVTSLKQLISTPKTGVKIPRHEKIRSWGRDTRGLRVRHALFQLASMHESNALRLERAQ